MKNGETDSEQIPVPDPTRRTNEAIERVVRQRDELVEAQLSIHDAKLAGFREAVITRLDAVDKATVVFQEALVRAPTETDKQVGNLKELLLTRFVSVDQRFIDLASRTTEDKRVAQEALVAALAAAKELVGKQNEFSAAAIDKSEANTTKTIEKNRELAEATTAAISQQVVDLKELLALWRADTTAMIATLRSELVAVNTIRTVTKDVTQEQHTDSRANQNLALYVLTVVLAIIATVATVYGMTGR